VGIESLKFNVTPIFYGASSQSGLNVLSYNPVVQLDIDSPSKFLNFLDMKSEMLSKNIKNKIYSELFEPVKYSELNNLFNLS
jgi:hypothetical protein